MDTQTILALAIVLAAALYVGRRAWRTVRAGSAKSDEGCGSDCGCH